MIDMIYCISMERYPERRENAIRLLSSLTSICPVSFFDAIDANKYSERDFNDQGVFAYPDWEIENPEKDNRIDHQKISNYSLEDRVGRFWNRPITRGEIGCMLSHYYVWVDAYKNGYQTVLIFEDDLTFDEDKLVSGLQIYCDFRSSNAYDIFYLGGAPMIDGERKSEFVVRCDYIYQTHAYIITRECIGIMMNSGCEKTIIPADEFFSMSIGEHPRYDIRSNVYSFERKLRGYRLNDLVVEQLNQGGHTTEMVV
jgi:collagen beta-1,O-galactosyltransferase